MANTGRILLWFFGWKVATAIAATLAQLGLFLVDLEATPLLVPALWLVTGVFTAVFASGVTDYMGEIPGGKHRRVGTVLVALAVVAIAAAVYLIVEHDFGGDPAESFLPFTNGYVVVSFYLGVGLAGLVIRSMDERPTARSGANAVD